MMEKRLAEFFIRLGTTPGPTVYLKENQTTWVRVHNDLPAENLTIVRH